MIAIGFSALFLPCWLALFISLYGRPMTFSSVASSHRIPFLWPISFLLALSFLLEVSSHDHNFRPETPPKKKVNIRNLTIASSAKTKSFMTSHSHRSIRRAPRVRNLTPFQSHGGLTPSHLLGCCLPTTRKELRIRDWARCVNDAPCLR